MSQFTLTSVDPNPRRGPQPRTPRENFERKVERTPGGCWVWTGVTHTGYGIFGTRIDGTVRTGLAHRWSYREYVGPIPDGHELHHRCENRACVRPSHLQVVTRAEHIALTPRTQKAHCPHGHAYTPDNLAAHPKGWRVCLTCKRLASVAERARRNA